MHFNAFVYFKMRAMDTIVRELETVRPSMGNAPARMTLYLMMTEHVLVSLEGHIMLLFSFKNVLLIHSLCQIP